MGLDWLVGKPTPAESLVAHHVNKVVKARAVELEAFIVAWCRATDINPCDIVLEQTYNPCADAMESRVVYKAIDRYREDV